jgi:hypothetical protein
MTTHAASARLAIVIVMAATLPSLPPAARAQDARSLPALTEGPIGALKQAYLACNDAALQRALGGGEAAICSVIYEALKRRAFDGDFQRLLAWSRAADAERMAAATEPDGQATDPMPAAPAQKR